MRRRNALHRAIRAFWRWVNLGWLGTDPSAINEEGWDYQLTNHSENIGYLYKTSQIGIFSSRRWLVWTRHPIYCHFVLKTLRISELKILEVPVFMVFFCGRGSQLWWFPKGTRCSPQISGYKMIQRSHWTARPGFFLGISFLIDIEKWFVVSD